MRGLRWSAGLLRRTPMLMVGPALALAVTIAFVAALLAFVSASGAALTVHAAAGVPVDWQVQLTPGADLAAVDRAVAALPDVRARADVLGAVVPGLSSTSGGATRTTGQARLLALPPDYGTLFPAQVRPLVGARTGVLVTQQTAANLAVVPGGTVTVGRPDGSSAAVVVDGVVDLPNADSLFQVVGAAPGAGAAAPPDNVLIVPPDRFAAVAGGSPAVRQIHLGFDHAHLPANPGAAAALISQRDNAFQAAVAGGALVGDNVQAALSAAREDALYALLLVLLLGVPGVVLAGSVSAMVVGLRGDRRRREAAVLAARGAGPGALTRLVLGETAVTCVLAVTAGVLLAEAVVRWALPGPVGLSRGQLVWAAAVGVVIAVVTQTGPVLRSALSSSAGAVRAELAGDVAVRAPWPLRWWLDVVLLGVAGMAFLLTARGGYQVVLAPEGVPQTSVNYAALLAPALAWPGLALLAWRVTAAALARRTGARAGRRRAGAPEIVAASLRQRRHVIARGATGLGVAVGLAASTAVFTATYDRQAALDVALTVGADVAVTTPASATTSTSTSPTTPASPTTPTSPAMSATELARTVQQAPGVRAVEPLQHRFAYVGPDLQDIFGVRPASIAAVAPLLDSFTPGSSVTASMARLAATPDGVLLSAETLRDYQLRPGDLIRLRLQSGPDQQYRPVDFHVVGRVNEFPTAPKDSFIVANASYLSARTGAATADTLLISSSDPSGTALALRQRLAGTAAVVRDVVSARPTVTTASGLAATNLSGLSRLELGFGLVLAVVSSALALLLGVVQRRRALVLLGALGATPAQRRQFAASEAWALVLAGLLAGAGIAAAISYVLVKVLTGIFDPAPTGPAVPVTYLAGLLAAVTASTAVTVAAVTRYVARAGLSELRAT